MSDGLSKNCNEKHPTQIQKLIGHTQGLTEKVPVPSTLQYHPLTTTTQVLFAQMLNIAVASDCDLKMIGKLLMKSHH